LRITKLNYFKRLILSNLIILAIVAGAFILIYIKVDASLRDFSVKTGLSGLAKSVSEFEDRLYGYRLKGETIFSEDTVTSLASQSELGHRDYYTMHRIIQLMQNYFVDDRLIESDITYFPTPGVTKIGQSFIGDDDISRNWIYRINGQPLSDYFARLVSPHPYTSLVSASLTDPGGEKDTLLFVFQTDRMTSRDRAVTAIAFNTKNLTELFTFFPDDRNSAFLLRDSSDNVLFGFGQAEPHGDFASYPSGSGWYSKNGTVELYHNAAQFNLLYTVTVSQDYFDEHTASLRSFLIASILALLVMCFGIGVWLSSRNARPIARLMRFVTTPPQVKGNEFEIIYKNMETINKRNETLTNELQRNNALMSELLASSRVSISYPIDVELALIAAVTNADYKKTRSILTTVIQSSLEGRRGDDRFAACAQLSSALRRTVLRILSVMPGTVHISSVLDPGSLNQFDSPEDFESEIMEVFDSLCTEMAAVSMRSDTMIMRINEYIAANFTNPDLSLPQIAERFSLSKSYLSRIYKEKCGVNMSASIEKLRMEKAMALLNETDLTVAQICCEVGYLSPNSFYKAFKRFYGISPKQCREINL
jgi:AraC-like DNA-binding protein